jgi:hypothetical protein
MANYLILDDRDNVAVAIEALEKAMVIELPGEKRLTLNNPIPFAHKFAIRDLKEDEKIIKQGAVIGVATQAIKTGDHVHVHNIRGAYID